jgi:hypothetical protein
MQVFAEMPPVLAPLPWQGVVLEHQLRAAAQQHLCGGALKEQALSPGEWAEVEQIQRSAEVGAR